MTWHNSLVWILPNPLLGTVIKASNGGSDGQRHRQSQLTLPAWPVTSSTPSRRQSRSLVKPQEAPHTLLSPLWFLTFPLFPQVSVEGSGGGGASGAWLLNFYFANNNCSSQKGLICLHCQAAVTRLPPHIGNRAPPTSDQTFLGTSTVPPRSQFPHLLFGDNITRAIGLLEGVQSRTPHPPPNRLGTKPGSLVLQWTWTEFIKIQ